ncbi:MAG: GNAT family N-acetyltransferase, partial [Roseivirga sp.]|nr:GNAT family N-acetyltransferase [Roseivirga sp.]
VELRSLKNSDGKIVGFLGAAEGNLEMLFLHPDLRRKGLGKLLLNYAIEQLRIQKVDVNEQNPEATAFYLKQGFAVIGRSETDPQGKPYPILHLKLK